MLNDRHDRRHTASQRQKYFQFGSLAIWPGQSDGNNDSGAPIWNTLLPQWIRNRVAARGAHRRFHSAGILNKQAYAPIALSCDAVAIVLASLAAGAIYDLLAFGQVGDTSFFFGAGILVSLLFCGISRVKALRLPFGTSIAYERAQTAISSWLTAFTLFLFIAFTMKIAGHLSRGAILSFFALGAITSTISRANAPILLARFLRRGTLDAQDLIVIGPQSDPSLFQLIVDLRRTVRADPWTVMFDGGCGDDAWPTEMSRILDHVFRLAHRVGPGEILVAGARLPPDRLAKLLAGLTKIPRAVCLVPDGFIATSLRQNITAIGESVAVEVQRAPLGATQRSVKRIGDIILSALAILFLAPLFVVIAIAIKYDSLGPVLFRQTRTGYRGRTFEIFKFRTMSVLENGPTLAQARKHDHRVTTVGSFLRRSSLDELPQLFNVLLGHMSLVGPRPHAVAHDDLYGRHIPNYALRQHVLPGITGWAQVNGLRGETSTMEAMYQRVEHDVWYVKHCSLFLDLQIMARTIFEV
ncbi:MAG: exopolysaccharide biosynthesis polyprenyl glycosylphosphotransferase, partial [Alphaproteobacteria bacterium]|nr:exopolysaccharide biosynthesis polyprenyl glycosylphosphotransferase [Alphaproteobacteria bacterium]